MRGWEDWAWLDGRDGPDKAVQIFGPEWLSAAGRLLHTRVCHGKTEEEDFFRGEGREGECARARGAAEAFESFTRRATNGAESETQDEDG
jgi:hypothetical protein